MVRTIPVVSLKQYLEGDKVTFAKELGEAFHEIGFVGVVDHGISPALIDDFYAKSKAFFAMPTATKQKYEIAGLFGQRGYTSFGKEHAKQSEVADLKEFFQIGQEVTDGDPVKETYPENVFVEEIPRFTPLAIELFKAFEQVGIELLRAIALFLDLPENWFGEQVHNGNSILRAIHYPPITEEPDTAIRAEQHEDINLITLLVGASAGGLEILSKDDQWLPIVPEQNEIVINVGDMLQRLTNNYLKSTTHRVVNPPRDQWHLPRLSIPFFLHPKMDMDLACLDSCVSTLQPKAYEDMTAGEYLEERLREIGLKE